MTGVVICLGGIKNRGKMSGWLNVCVAECLSCPMSDGDISGDFVSSC